MRTLHSRRAREAGSMLFMAVVLVAILSIATTAALRYLHMSMAEIKRQENAETALALAEAGLEKAAAMLRLHPGDYSGETGTPLGAGQFSVTVTRGAQPGVWTLRSVGVVDSGDAPGTRQTLLSEAERRPDGSLRIGAWRVEKRTGLARTPAQSSSAEGTHHERD